MNKKTPISYIYKNMLVANTSASMLNPLKRFSFVYKLIGEPYELETHNAKLKIIEKQARLIIDIKSQAKLFGVPRLQNVKKHYQKEREDIERTEKRTSEHFSLKKESEQYDALVEDYLTRDMEARGYSELETYLIIEAPLGSFDIDNLRSLKDRFISEPLNTVQKFFDGRTRFTQTQLRQLEALNDTYLMNTRASGIELEAVSSDEIVSILSGARTRGLSVFPEEKTAFILEEDGKELTPFVHDLEPLFNARFSFETPRVLTVETEHGISYQAFINVYSIPTHTAPDFEWIHMLRDFSFPVLWSMYVYPKDKEASKSDLTQKKMRIKAEEQNAREKGSQPPKELSESKRALGHLEESLSREDSGVRHWSITIGLYADSVAKLEERVAMFMQKYKNAKFQLARADNRIDLQNAYIETLLTMEHKTNAFHILVPSINIGSTVYASSTRFGDDSGRYLGYTGRSRKKVFLKKANAVYRNMSAGHAIVADLGGGKSFLANLDAYMSVLHGEQVITIDPKGGRSERFHKFLPELRGKLNIITVENSEEFRGVFDPFNIYTDDYEEVTTSGEVIKGYELAKEMATDIIYDSIAEMDDEKEVILNDAFALMKDDPSKSMTKLVAYIKEVDKDDESDVSLHNKAQVFSRLVATLNEGLSRLYFGKGTDEERQRTMDLSHPWTVIETQNIPFPPKDKKTEDYTKKERSSVILNSLILNTIRKFAFTKRNTHLMIQVDEAHVYRGSRIGEATLSQMDKMQRQLNFHMVYLVHSLKDLPPEILNTITYVTYFRSENILEIPERLKFIGLDSYIENIKMMQGLRTGECIYRDADKNVAKIQIDAVIPRLIEAFSSTPEH